jgi:hypothetical protein
MTEFVHPDGRPVLPDEQRRRHSQYDGGARLVRQNFTYILPLSLPLLLPLFFGIKQNLPGGRS